MVIISRVQTSRGVKTNGLEIESKMFRTSPGFAVGSVIIFGILAVFYTLFR
jgi:solute:Na+ symporter, SSS family